MKPKKKKKTKKNLFCMLSGTGRAKLTNICYSVEDCVKLVSFPQDRRMSTPNTHNIHLPYRDWTPLQQPAVENSEKRQVLVSTLYWSEFLNGSAEEFLI